MVQRTRANTGADGHVERGGSGTRVLTPWPLEQTAIHVHHAPEAVRILCTVREAPCTRRQGSHAVHTYTQAKERQVTHSMTVRGQTQSGAAASPPGSYPTDRSSCLSQSQGRPLGQTSSPRRCVTHARDEQVEGVGHAGRTVMVADAARIPDGVGHESTEVTAQDDLGTASVIVSPANDGGSWVGNRHAGARLASEGQARVVRFLAPTWTHRGPREAVGTWSTVKSINQSRQGCQGLEVVEGAAWPALGSIGHGSCEANTQRPAVIEPVQGGYVSLQYTDHTAIDSPRSRLRLQTGWGHPASAHPRRCPPRRRFARGGPFLAPTRPTTGACTA